MHTLGQTMGLEITREGEKPDALYIVRTGIVSIMVMGEEVMEAMHGDLIGENEILNLTQGYRRNRTCVAKTSCELCRLLRCDLLDSRGSFTYPHHSPIGSCFSQH